MSDSDKGSLITLRDSQSWRPLRTQNIQTDAAIWIDVRMVDASGERNLKDWLNNDKIDNVIPLAAWMDSLLGSG